MDQLIKRFGKSKLIITMIDGTKYKNVSINQCYDNKFLDIAQENGQILYVGINAVKEIKFCL